MIHMKKIAAVITDLFEDIEYTSPKEAYENAGHEVVTIGCEKGSEVTGKQGTVITTDVGIDDVTPDQFDALFIPGGFSPDQLRADERFVQFAKTFMDEKKPVFTICHYSRDITRSRYYRIYIDSRRLKKCRSNRT